MPENETFRRLPQQERSRQRLEQILDAAAEVFDDVGYERASTELIAGKAKTSIGSVYRFFPDKAAIAYALAERYAHQMEELVLECFNSYTVSDSLEQIISYTVDAFDEFYTSQPGCRTIMILSLTSPDIQAVNKRADIKIIQKLDDFFASLNQDIDPVKRKLAARVSIEIGNALQLQSLAEDDEYRMQMVQETKSVIIRYLEPLFSQTD